MPSLKLNRNEGPVGTEVRVMGTGFRPNVSYRIQLASTWLKPGTMSNRGTFNAAICIPTVPYGDQDIIVVSQAAHQLAQAIYTVTPEVQLVTEGEREMTIRGTGFGSREGLSVFLDDQPINVSHDPKTESDGTFQVASGVASPHPSVVCVVGRQTGATAQAAWPEPIASDTSD